jgi:Zn-finger nucleic acid-binding protein
MQTCPSCKTARLQAADLEPGLKARLCPHCRGHWIPFADYLPWIEAGASIADPTRGADEPSELFAAADQNGIQAGGVGAPTSPPMAGPTQPVTPAAAKVRLCPECGRFLRRYQLGLGIEFEVERCGGCAGVWCDRGKWPRLKAAGAHARLHLLFSDSWQAKLKDEQIRKRQEDRVRSILGEADHSRAREFKVWVDSHPHRATLRAFLAEDFDDKPPPSSR